MRLLFKQRFFSWLCSYDVYGQDGLPVFKVEGQLAWGHCLKIFDGCGNEMGLVKQQIFTFLPKFEIYAHGSYLGCICRELSFFTPKYHIEYNGWQVEGNIWEWDYVIRDPQGRLIATVSKQLFNWTDTYVLDVPDPKNALLVLMLVIAIDAEKCSRDK